MLIPAQNLPIILASKSPRRRELLTQIGVEFEVIDIEIDESVKMGETANDYVYRMAKEKAVFAWESPATQSIADYNQRALIAADTSVVFGTQVLGKPNTLEESMSMISMLAGNIHQVMTYVALVNRLGISVKGCHVDVEFAPLSSEEVERYCETGEGMDKAGSYGIQGVASQFIKSIHGSYSGVVGLPLYETSLLLKQHFENIK